MNQNQTAPSGNIITVAKFILFKCVPLTMASLFASSSFAAEQGCPNNDYIYKHFETKFHIVDRTSKDYYLKTSDNSDWKLSYGDESYKGTQMHQPLGLYKVDVKMISEDPNGTIIERVECRYRKNGKAGTDSTGTITLTMSNYAYLYSDEYLRGSVNGPDQLGYKLNTGRLSKIDFWTTPSGTPGNWQSSCPRTQDGDPLMCTFKYELAFQRNGYWEDAGWRCGSYVECSKRRRDIRAFVKEKTQATKGCRKNNDPNGELDLTCQDAIKYVNTKVAEMAYWNSGGKAWPWTTCWYQKPEFAKTFKVTKALEGAPNPVIEEMQGTAVWNWIRSNDDHNGDTARARACHRYSVDNVVQTLGGNWPDYGALGYREVN